MNKILIDTSIWIEYFSGDNKNISLDKLIDEDIICTNEIILCELIPFLKDKKEYELVDLLQSIDLINLNIEWNKIIEYQTINLKNNLRKIGIPDLIILQNIINNNLTFYTLDKHFKQMEKIHKISLYEI